MVLPMSDSMNSINNVLNHKRKPSGSRHHQGHSGLILKGPATFDLDDGNTPKTLETNVFRWWADDAASTLKTSLDESYNRNYDDSLPNSSDELLVDKIVRRICIQLSKQISESAYQDVTYSFRNKLKTLERACQTVIQENHMRNKETDARSEIIAAKMESIIMRRMPEEITKWIAMEVHSLLINEEVSSEDIDEDLFVDTFDDEESPGRETNTQLGRWSITQRSIPSTTTDVSSHMRIKSSDRGIPPQSKSQKYTKYEDNTDDFHRKFYNDNDDSKLQMEAFKKFLLVLVKGRGFRVLKHNHGGGRKLRILKYNTQKNRIFWESSKILGSEYIECRAITRVDREENVVYVWHQVGRNRKRKMVGLETQREYDARVLELALLHLFNQNPHRITA